MDKRLAKIFERCIHDLNSESMQVLQQALPEILEQRFTQYTHGFISRWLDLIQALPVTDNHSQDLIQQVRVGDQFSLDEDTRTQLIETLKQFHPWRKGPFHLHGITIDTEWRSDWKWDRLLPHISPLENRHVLDVGCGSGYHCWRMLGQNARCVIGIDPSQLFMIQFLAIKHFIGQAPIHYLPIGIEALPSNLEAFDTVFSMGVLYHRQSPFEHLAQLRGLLGEGGELVLETLVVDGDEQTVLVPGERYASMKNVWFLPSVKALEAWLARAGFKHIRTVDINQTSVQEQRQTEWMQFHSLQQFLASDNLNQTLEGYPAPKRAIIIAEK